MTRPKPSGKNTDLDTLMFYSNNPNRKTPGDHDKMEKEIKETQYSWGKP